MTPERAQEILQRGKLEGEFRKYMTEDGIALVFDMWNTQSGSSSFYEII